MGFVWGIPILFGLLVLAGNGALYRWRARHGRDAPEHADESLTVLDAAWTFVKETAALAVVLLLLPFGWCVPRCRSGAGARGPVILVHGWALNRGSLWLLRRRLLRDGWGPACCFDYPWLSVDVEAAARQLHEVVGALAARERRPITCIGHSLGGLVLRYFARRYPAPSVRRIVTLGTPHHGTDLGRIFGQRGRSLLPGSRLLNTLNAGDHVPQQFDVIAIHSTFDAMIVPPGNAIYPGAFNIQVNNVGHNALLFSTKVYQLIAENLGAPLP